MANPLCNSSVHDRDPVHALGLQLLDEVSQPLVPHRIVGEVLVVRQVVDVRELSVERQVVVRVVLDDLLDDVEVLVAPSALLPAETPLRYKDRFPTTVW